jgi:hypothetical protein
MRLVPKEISWEWKKRYVSIQTSYGKNFRCLSPSNDFSFCVAMDCLCQIMLNQKLACKFEKRCKFSSCAKAKSRKKKSHETTCLYSTIAVLFQFVQNIPYLYNSKIWCHSKCHDSASVKCTIVIPILEVCKAKLLVSHVREIKVYGRGWWSMVWCSYRISRKWVRCRQVTVRQSIF